MTGESEQLQCSKVGSVESLAAATKDIDLLILAAGFEERAYKVLPDGEFSTSSHCVLVRFISAVAGNDTVFDKYMSCALRKFSPERIHVVDLHHATPQGLGDEFCKLLIGLPKELRRFAIDVSGLPSHAVCTLLKVARDFRPEEDLSVFYTAAREYVPTKAEYDKVSHREEIELLPKSMALEMDENLVLDAFSGYRSQNARVCLAVFAGYEAHRSTGIIEAVNPALLLLLYGKPGNARLSWRLDLSRKLHRKFEKSRRTATEVVSTLHVQESLDVLEDYYNYLIDDYDLVISPISSKMHIIAAYLFWEKYGEVQLTFPIPIGYNPANAPRGVGLTYCVCLYPRRRFFRQYGERPQPADV